MNNQAFSTANLQSVWSYLERSGNKMLGFNSDVDDSIRSILKLAGKRNEKLRHSPKDKLARTQIKKDFTKEINILKIEKELVLERYLQGVVDKFSTKTSNSTFTWAIEKSIEIGDEGKKKQTYRLPNDDPEQFLLAKQLEWNLKSVYRIRGTDRHQIVGELVRTLSSPIPTNLIKTDIASFFESVPHDRLMHILTENCLLSQTSVLLVRKLLSEYEILSHTPGKGLPRGIGISAKLAELYLSKLDQTINHDESIYYYARFVDDIVFAVPQSSSSWGKCQKDVEKHLTKIMRTYGLKINIEKTSFIEIGKNKKHFTFLGYDICVSEFDVQLKISRNRLNKYKLRIKESFDAYNTSSKKAEATSALLLNRIRFLSANTRLRGSKRNVFSGIYFSNPSISTTDHLGALTTFTANEISKIADDHLKMRLKQLDFIDNYTNKKLFLFNDRTLKAIPRVWSK